MYARLSIGELRNKVQGPVQNNGPLWYLGAGRISVYVTRAFIALHLSADFASYLMLAVALVGSALLPWGDGMAALGFGLLSLYYILDIVDGELARFYGGERLIWAFYDYLFHLLVKSTFFFFLGWAAFRAVGEIWILVPVFTCFTAGLVVRFLQDLPLTLTSRYVLLKAPRDRARFVAQVLPESTVRQEARAPAEPDKGGLARSRKTLLRTAAANFETALVVFLLGALLDLILAPFEIAGRTFDLKLALLCLYGVIFPLDALDRLLTSLRRGEFLLKSRELLIRAHRFQLDR